MQSMFSDHDAFRLDISNKNVHGKFPNIRKLNTYFQITQELKEKLKRK